MGVRKNTFFRIIYTTALFLVITLILSSCLPKKEVSLGAIISLTGFGSTMKDVKRGMETAVQEINTTGGLNGQKIALHIEDSRSNTEIAVEKFNELYKKHSPLITLSTLSSTTKAISPYAEEKKTPLIGLVATDPSITKNKKWTYVFYPSAQHETGPIFSIVKQKKIKSLGIIYFNDAYGNSVVADMERRVEDTEIQLKSYAYTEKESQFNSIISKSMQHDALYLVGFSNHILNMYQELNSRAYDGVLLSTSTVTVPSFRKGNNIDGLYAAAPLIYNQSYVFAQKVAARYEKRYKKELSHYAATGYDIIKIIAGLLEGEDITRDSVMDMLDKGFIYPGLFGEITLPEKSHNIFFPLHPVKIEEGNITYIQ